MPPIQNPEAINEFIHSFSVVSFGFVFYYFFTGSPSFKLWESLKSDNTRPVLIQRLTGIFFFGFVPIIIILFFLRSNLTNYGTGMPDYKTLIWLLLLSVVIIPLNYFNSKNTDNLSHYPQIRNPEWSYSLILLSALSWIAYLFAYEFLFRGFFLFTSVAVLGIWPAIILNAGVYSLVHLPKGSKETLGAIPFGILLAYLVIETGSFWIAFFAHVILALSNEWSSLAAQPEMHLKKYKT
ncbi:MAG: CPBP family intramembrane glutamic endopeptidase [Candidatus Paceibacterota bacterium]